MSPANVEPKVAPDGVNFVRELITDGLNAAIASAVAARIADPARNRMDRVPATKESALISAIAKGIDSTDQYAGRGIAWIVTGITGMQEFPAQVLGSLITSVRFPSFKLLARGLRVFGAVCSAYD